MRIGVLDSGGKFENLFFQNKNIKVFDKRYKNTAATDFLGFTHAEYVCSYIAKENPEAEIILLPIININQRCSVRNLIDGINLLVKYKVDVINMSIGNEYKYHRELEVACKKAFEQGILLVAAYSNNKVRWTYPASFPFVVGVKCNEEKKANYIIQYDRKNNDIIFSSRFFSLYHLGIPKLQYGNSFACAVITGILSHNKDFYRRFLSTFSESVFNRYYSYHDLKQKKCCFLTNRIDEPFEKKFIAEVTNTVICQTFCEGLEKVIIPKVIPRECQVLFIDHNDYVSIWPYKEYIHKYIKSYKEIKVVLRYPLFSLSERFDFFIRQQRSIYQFFI